MMANLLILTLVFSPDNVSTAQLMSDLAEELQGKGHLVTVVTSEPHYNRDTATWAGQPMRSRWFGLVKERNCKGVRVLHAWMPRKGKNMAYRALTWLNFHVLTTLAGILCVKRVDVVLSPSPPLTIGLSAWLLGWFHSARYIYNVQEVYPDVAVNLGAIKNRGLIRLLFRLERLVYAKASAVTVISRRMRERLQGKGVPDCKLVLIPNFVDVHDFRPLEKRNEFSTRHGLVDRFVVSYAGNMGKPQHLETLLLAAFELRNHAGIRFLLMGSGSEYEPLQQRAADLRLANVLFLPQQPYEIMPMAYAAADVCYVPQAIGTSADGIPSKVYRIMAAARTVIASTDVDSDLAELVQEGNCGYVVTSHDPRELSQVIGKAAGEAEQCARLGANGRDYVIKHYERAAVVKRYDDLVTDLANAAVA